MSNGPNIPLVVQYSFCANAPDEAAMHSTPSSAAMMPDFFMFDSSLEFSGRSFTFFSPYAPHVLRGSARVYWCRGHIGYLRYGASGVCPFRINASIGAAR